MPAAWALLAAALALPAAAAYDDCTDVAAVQEHNRKANALVGLLIEGRHDELEATLGPLVTAYEEGRISDGELDRWFLGFVEVRVVFPERLARWSAAYPKSYAARLAAAKQMYSFAGDARGARDASVTGPGQFAMMQSGLDTALRFLDEADALSSRPVLSIPIRMAALRMGQIGTGHEARRRSLLDRAEKLDPGNVTAKVGAVWMAMPKWGGSVEEIDRLERRFHEADLAPAVRNRVLATIAFARGDNLRVMAKDPEAGYPYLERAIRACPGHLGALRALAFHWRRAKDPARAFEFAQRYVALDPTVAALHELKASVAAELARWEETREAAHMAIAMGSANAAMLLGGLHEKGTMGAIDLGAALGYYEAAWLLGHAPAEESASRARALLARDKT